MTRRLLAPIPPDRVLGFITQSRSSFRRQLLWVASILFLVSMSLLDPLVGAGGAFAAAAIRQAGG